MKKSSARLFAASLDNRNVDFRSLFPASVVWDDGEDGFPRGVGSDEHLRIGSLEAFLADTFDADAVSWRDNAHSIAFAIRHQTQIASIAAVIASHQMELLSDVQLDIALGELQYGSLATSIEDLNGVIVCRLVGLRSLCRTVGNPDTDVGDEVRVGIDGEAQDTGLAIDGGKVYS